MERGKTLVTKLQTKPYQVELYKIIKEVGNIISQESTIEILHFLSYEPMRYTKLKELTKCTDNTLVRRLYKLLEYDLIKRFDVIYNNKQTYEYAITELGQELIKFFRHYELRRNKLKQKKTGGGIGRQGD